MALEKEDTLDLNRLFQRAIFEVNFSPSGTRFQVVCQCGSNKGSVTWSQVPGHRKWFGTNNPPLLLLNDLGSLTCLRWQLSSKFSASCFFFQASCLPDFCLVSLTVLASLQFNSVRYTANAYRQPNRFCINSPTDGQVMLSECDLFWFLFFTSWVPLT